MARCALPRRSKGFTLLEVMIAVAIFAVIGLGSWQVLDRVITSKQQVEVRSEQLRQLQKAVWLISRDIRNIVDRPVRNTIGEVEAPVSSLIPGYALTLTRSGWSNPLNQPRSTLQRVAYGLEPNDRGSNDLVRYTWAALDQAPDAEPHRQQILTGIQYFEAQFINSLGEQQFHWPSDNLDGQQQNIASMPSGIMVRLETTTFGEIKRLFALRDIEEAKQ